MNEIEKEITVNGEVVASAIFSGILAQSADKVSQFLGKIDSILSNNKSGKLDFGLQNHYSRAGSVVLFHFIDPLNPRVSEAMVSIIPKKGQGDKFSELFVQTMNASFVKPGDSKAIPRKQLKPTMA